MDWGLNGLGPFFAVHAHPAGATPAAPWRPLRELLDEPTILAERIAAIQSYLAAGGGQPSPRVAASVTHLGLVARLVSPTIGVAAVSGEFPAIDLADVWWQPELGGTFPLSAHYRPDGSAAAFVDGPLRTLTAAFAVSNKILRGNVASAVNGAATMIAATRPDLAGRVAALADAVLATPWLRETGTRRANGRFQRRSCCLIYQAAATPTRNAVCADCVLVP
jgi:hypothetical protein